MSFSRRDFLKRVGKIGVGVILAPVAASVIVDELSSGLGMSRGATAHLIDELGQPVIIPPGMYQQIINKDTYAQLTEEKLIEMVKDIFFNPSAYKEEAIAENWFNIPYDNEEKVSVSKA